MQRGANESQAEQRRCCKEISYSFLWRCGGKRQDTRWESDKYFFLLLGRKIMLIYHRDVVKEECKSSRKTYFPKRNFRSTFFTRYPLWKIKITMSSDLVCLCVCFVWNLISHYISLTVNISVLHFAPHSSKYSQNCCKKEDNFAYLKFLRRLHFTLHLRQSSNFLFSQEILISHFTMQSELGLRVDGNWNVSNFFLCFSFDTFDSKETRYSLAAHKNPHQSRKTSHFHLSLYLHDTPTARVDAFDFAERDCLRVRRSINSTLEHASRTRISIHRKEFRRGQ